MHDTKPTRRQRERRRRREQFNSLLTQWLSVTVYYPWQSGKVIPRHCSLVTCNQRVNWTYSIRNSCNVLTFLLYDLLKQWTSGRHMCVYRLKCSSGNGRHEQDSDFWHQLPSRPPLPCVGRLCVPCYTLTIHETCVGHTTCTLNPIELWQYLQLM